MPVSVRRHNLVRLREELSLTQAALAALVESWTQEQTDPAVDLDTLSRDEPHIRAGKIAVVGA